MQKTMKTTFPVLILMICIACGGAMAQTGFGLRAGATADPNQFHFGAHYVSEPLAWDLLFRPNLEIGFGSDTTAVAANLEFAYRIKIPNKDFSAYIGAGPSLNVYRHRSKDTNTGGGFNILIGMEHEKGLFGEVKVGAFDSPEVKFTVGYTFH